MMVCVSLPDGLHHSRVPQLSCAQLTIKDQSSFLLVWLHTPHKEWLTLTEGGHEGVQ